MAVWCQVRGWDVEFGTAVMVVPVVVGLIAAARRLGLPSAYAAPLGVGLGLLISLGYTVAGGLPGGTAVADAVLRGVAIGLSSAGVYAGLRRGARGGHERAARR